MNLDSHSRKALQDFGWEQGRNIDPTPFVTVLAKEGFTAFGAALQFYASFGGLKGKFGGAGLNFTLKEV